MSTYAFNIRSFYTEDGKRDLGNGIEIWRGYFQSVRPAVGRLLINVDTSTAIMYKSGPLIDVCLDFLGPWFVTRGPAILGPAPGPQEQDRKRTIKRLSDFMKGVKVNIMDGQNVRQVMRIQSIPELPATQSTFSINDETRTVAQHFEMTHNRPLQYPRLPCIKVGRSF